MVCTAFGFFEGLLGTEVQKNRSIRMPPAAQHVVTSDLFCLMLSFLYDDWQIAGVTEDRATGKCRHVKQGLNVYVTVPAFHQQRCLADTGTSRRLLTFWE